jgi:formylglycine-generating enzyme required for sulfatase activity
MTASEAVVKRRSAGALGLVVLMTSLALWSCGEDVSEPQRDNPLDLANPQTHGDPFNLRVVRATRDTVTLAWDAVPVTGIAKYRLRRWTGAQGHTPVYHDVDNTVFSYVDTAIQSDSTYSYKLAVLDAGGEESDTARQEPVVVYVVANVLPVVAISSPLNGASFNAGTSITFQGSATDAEDGVLTGAALVWSSDRDGPFGTGVSVTTGALSTNVHMITLQATDSDGGSSSASITIHVGGPPSIPANPTPGLNAQNVAVTTGLSWQASIDPDGGTVTYDVHFGLNSPPPQVTTNQTFASYDPPGELLPGTTYYWRVVARDDESVQTPSPIWVFTTIGPSVPTAPSPATGAVNVALTTPLSWQASVDPDGGPVTYDVYLDTTDPPTYVYLDLSETTMWPSQPLAPSTVFYWKVVARDDEGGTSSSPVWHFTTLANQSPTAPTNPVPADYAWHVPVTATLSWQASVDPDGGAVTYNVYLGTSALMYLVSDHQAGTSYDPPGDLAVGQEYFWRVEAVDEASAQTPSADWTFWTSPEEFSFVAPGTFTMGSPPTEPGRSTNEGQHAVTLTRGFYLARREVTEEFWAQIMGGVSTSQLPQVSVTWYDAIRFCNALSNQASLDTAYVGAGITWTCNWNANGYRLPTEAEWEYACRAGSTTAFANGAIADTLCGPNPNLEVIGWYCGNSGTPNVRHAVGGRVANAWGLHDMHGNVWEWCWDWYGDYPTAPVTDPRGSEVGTERVLRGGSFNAWAKNCRSAERYRSGPQYSLSRLGLRLARSAE